MTSRRSVNLLVLRRDTATGFAKVGWAVDMPVGRFDHIEQICETRDFPNDTAHPHYPQYRGACRRARQLNQPLLQRQQAQLLQQGCVPVPLNLDMPAAEAQADDFGSYQYIAMQALYRLTGNVTDVWAVVESQRVVRLQSCRPGRAMEALEHQVWKNHCLTQLLAMRGEVYRGRLVVRESGLWFCATGTPIERAETE